MLETTLDANYSTRGMLEPTFDANYSTGRYFRGYNDSTGGMLEIT